MTSPSTGANSTAWFNLSQYTQSIPSVGEAVQAVVSADKCSLIPTFSSATCGYFAVDAVQSALRNDHKNAYQKTAGALASAFVGSVFTPENANHTITAVGFVAGVAFGLRSQIQDFAVAQWDRLSAKVKEA